MYSDGAIKQDLIEWAHTKLRSLYLEIRLRLLLVKNTNGNNTPLLCVVHQQRQFDIRPNRINE